MSVEPAAEVHAPLPTERELVERARTGDRDAMGALYDLHLVSVYRYVLARVSSPHEAEDITEQIFLRVIEHIHRFEWREVPFSAWLFRIAKNQVISHYRGHKNHAAGVSTDTLDLEDGRLGPEAEVEHMFVMREVLEACDRLAKAQRDVIALRFGAGLSVRETAETLGKSENNVKVLQHKAIAKLQKLLGAG